MSFPALRLSPRWFSRPLILGVAAPLMLLAATGFLSLQYWHAWQTASQSVEHSRYVIDTLDRLRANITDVAAEWRGYLSTPDSSHLKPYGVSDESVRREGEALQTLVADDRLQSRDAAALMLTVSTTLRAMDEIVTMARPSRLDAALAIFGSMDEIRSQIDRMVDHERVLLVDRLRRIDALERNKTLLIAAAVVVATVFAGAALVRARLETRRRQTATEENVHLQSGLEQREAKIRRLVDANIIGIFFWEFGGRIIEANDTFLRIVGCDREDLVSGRLRWTDLTPPERRDRSAQAVDELKMAESLPPYEREYLRKDGTRVPVLTGSAVFDERRDQGVAFVLDLTERKRAEAEARESERRVREMQMEVAHANRVATMGQLTASIAHEVKQPIAAAVTNAEAALRWLGARPPNLEEIRQALDHIVKNANRASDVINRIRGIIKKTPSRKDRVDVNETIRGVIELTRVEAAKNGVSVQTALGKDLPLIEADRVQLQQVVLNLIVNAVQAMDSVEEGPRELWIATARAEHGVLVEVKDSGPGLPPANLEQLFAPFYTTKTDGLGMGLSICRSIIEAHGGRLSVTPNLPRGAIFYFTVPTYPDIAS
jgi:PAS domain S-box-containing protein